MAFKPNYNQQRADRDRAKAQKKQQTKLKRLEDESAKRKAVRSEESGEPDTKKDASGG